LDRYSGAELIAIEAKPFTGESDDQFGDYVSHGEALARRRENGKRSDAYFVFLTPDGRSPTSIKASDSSRLKSEGRLILLTYNSSASTPHRHKSIKEWIDLCAESKLPDRLVWFLREFSRHLAVLFPTESDIRGGATMRQEKALADFIVGRDANSVKAAWHIAFSREAIYGRIVSDFGKRLIAKLRKHDNSLIVECDTIVSDPMNDYAGLIWRKSNWPKGCGMALEIGEGYLSVGICAPTVEKRNAMNMDTPDYGAVSSVTQENIRRIIKPVLPAIGQTKRSDWWPIYVVPHAPLNDDENVDFLLTLAGIERFRGQPAEDVVVECFKAMHAVAGNLRF
jgi:PD-(D/E)XK nuclease superfamily